MTFNTNCPHTGLSSKHMTFWLRVSANASEEIQCSPHQDNQLQELQESSLPGHVYINSPEGPSYQKFWFQFCMLMNSSSIVQLQVVAQIVVSDITRRSLSVCWGHHWQIPRQKLNSLQWVYQVQEVGSSDLSQTVVVIDLIFCASIFFFLVYTLLSTSKKV